MELDKIQLAKAAKALKNYCDGATGIQTPTDIVKEATAAQMQTGDWVRAYCAELDPPLVIPGVTAVAEVVVAQPAEKPAKAAKPAPVELTPAVEEVVKKAEVGVAKKAVEDAKAVLALAEKTGKTRSIEAATADLADAEAALKALTGKPAKVRKEKVELAPAEVGDVLGEVPCTGVFYFSDLRDPFAVLKFLRFGKIEGHDNAAQGEYFDIRYRFFARAALKGDWKIFLLRGFAQNDELTESEVFLARSWAAGENGPACVSMYQYVGGDDLPVEGEALELVWDYDAHRFVVGAGKKAYKVERSKNGAASNRDGIELPTFGADAREQIRLPKVGRRGK